MSLAVAGLQKGVGSVGNVVRWCASSFTRRQSVMARSDVRKPLTQVSHASTSSNKPLFKSPVFRDDTFLGHSRHFSQVRFYSSRSSRSFEIPWLILPVLNPPVKTVSLPTMPLPKPIPTPFPGQFLGPDGLEYNDAPINLAGYMVSNDIGLLTAYHTALSGFKGQDVTVVTIGNGDTLSLLQYSSVKKMIIVDMNKDVLMFHQLMCRLLLECPTRKDFIKALFSQTCFDQTNLPDHLKKLDQYIKVLQRDIQNFLSSDVLYDVARTRLLKDPPVITYLCDDITDLSHHGKDLLSIIQTPAIVNLTNVSEHIARVPEHFVKLATRHNDQNKPCILFSSPVLQVPCGTADPATILEYSDQIKGLMVCE